VENGWGLGSTKAVELVGAVGALSTGTVAVVAGDSALGRVAKEVFGGAMERALEGAGSTGEEAGEDDSATG